MGGGGNVLDALVAGVAGFIFGGPAGAFAGVASVLLAPEPPGPPQPRQGLSFTPGGGVVSRRRVYGRCRVTATRVNAEGIDDNNQLWQHFALCEGPIKGVIDLYLDDLPQADHAAADLIERHDRLGHFSQAAEPESVSNMPSVDDSFRGRGVAWIATKFSFDQSKWSKGIPKMSAVVDGRLVWDPRDAGIVITGRSADGSKARTAANHDLANGDFVMLAGHDEWGIYEVAGASAWQFQLVRPSGENFGPAAGRVTRLAWSDNAALCILDIMMEMNRDLPWGTVQLMMDFASFGAAADICGQQVTVEGETQSRYTVNGVVDHDGNADDVIRGMLASCDGMITSTGGRVGLVVGAVTPPVMALTGDHLNGKLEFDTAPPRQDKFNTLSGEFLNAANRWLKEDSPKVKAPALITADGAELAHVQNLPFVTDALRAQRLHKITLEKHRRALRLVWQGDQSLAHLAVGDVVTVTLDHMGWDGRGFRVMKIDETREGGLQLALAEYDDDIYDWNDGEFSAALVAADTALPDITTVAVPGTVSFETDTGTAEWLADGTLASRVRIEWAAARDGFVSRYEAQWRITGAAGLAGDWQTKSVMADTRHIYVSPAPVRARIEARVRAFNIYDAVGAWVTADHLIQGNLPAPPPAPASVDIIHKTDATVTLLVAPVISAGLSHFEVRYRFAPLGVSPPAIETEQHWAEAKRLEEVFAPPARSGEAWRSTLNLPFSGTYRIYVRSVDRVGTMSPITEDASDIEPFVHRSGEIARQVYGGNEGWDGCEIERGMIGASGVILPLAGRTGAEIDALTRVAATKAAGLAKWTNAEGWLLSPANAAGIRFTSPPIDLTQSYRGTLEAQVKLRYPADLSRQTEQQVSRFLRYQRSSAGAPYRHEHLFDGSGDFGTIFTYQAQPKTAASTAGGWQFDSNAASTGSSHTGPATNNALNYWHTEMTSIGSTMAGFRAALGRGVATVKGAAWTRHMTGRQRRVTFRYVAAYAGALASHPKTGDGVMVQGRNAAGQWVDISMLPAWDYQDSVASGASITDVTGAAFTAAADGGWRDLTVTVPDAITGLRLQPRATMESGTSVSNHGYKYDFALRAITFEHGGEDWTPWQAIEHATKFEGRTFQLRVDVANLPDDTPARSFGLEKVTVIERAQSRPTAPQDIEVTSTAGVTVDYSDAGFQAPPQINAAVVRVSGNVHDYFVTGEDTADATEARLRIRHRTRGTYARGTIRWHALGLI